MTKYAISKEFRKIPVEKITKNPNQPRKRFDEEELLSLSRSIKTFGVITPLTVRKKGDGYELIAGERRLRAARMAGLSAVPCFIAEASDRDSSFMAIVENIERRDLDFFEEAASLKELIDNFGLTQAQVAEELGRTQSSVANKIRLLKLSDGAAQAIRENGLSERHARAILRLPKEKQEAAALYAAKRKLNVEQTEKHVDRALSSEKEEKRKRDVILIRDVRLFLNTLTRAAETMRRSGLDVKMNREETEKETKVTVLIPKAKKQTV